VRHVHTTRVVILVALLVIGAAALFALLRS
jgi:hypothetical protein